MNQAIVAAPMRRRALTGLLVVSLASLALAPAFAQDFPTKPVTMVVPFAPGGNTDVFTRVIAEKMSQHLKERVIVENRPGAGSTLGTAYVARAKPDGYTLLSHGAATLTPAFVKNLQFDIMKDLAPVGLYFQGSMLLLGSTANPATRSLGALAAYGKLNPGKLNFGAASAISRTGALMLQRELGIEAPVIVYKGSSEVMAAMARGEIDAAIDATNPIARAQIQAGKIRGIAVLGPNRNPVFPDFPLAAEAGKPQLQQTVSGGIWAPAGTPPDVIKKLNAALNAALKDPKVQEPIRQGGHKPVGSTPEEYRRLIQVESAYWSEAAKRAGVQPE